jgi:hypothetical protein
MSRAKRGFDAHGRHYQEPLLFVAGLPKSGTTWVESMLASYPGYHEVMIPEAVRYEIDNGGSHDFDLPADVFERFDQSLAVLKLHVPGSAHNVRLLREAGIPYLVIYRDLRDVAVSHYFYVRRTPWHPEHLTYKDLNVEQGLAHFGRTLLPDFVKWVRSWQQNRDPGVSTIIRYEELLENTKTVFGKVARCFGLDDDPALISRIVERHCFERLSGGRKKGQQSDSSFFRKGVSGDWKNHFTAEVEQIFDEKAGRFLRKQGAEAGHDT